jgi:protein tyrosine phosphatase
VGTKRTVSVARCYPMKNRAPDVLPFDQTRVELPTTKVSRQVSRLAIDPEGNFLKETRR